jgi:tRNA(Ile)-lysidine synthetase-like protein
LNSDLIQTAKEKQKFELVMADFLGLNELIQFWFSHTKIWFGATPEDDKIVKDRYEKFLLETHLLFADLNLSTLDPHQLLGLVILLDQVSRHIYRGQSDNIRPFHECSIKVANFMIDMNTDFELIAEQRPFVLLPLRHTFEIVQLERVIKRIILWRQTDRDKYGEIIGDRTYLRFLNATLTAYSKLVVPTINPAVDNDDISSDSIYNILDPISKRNLTELIKISAEEHIYKAFALTLHKMPNLNTVIVSLSGGVDSMVVLHCLSQLSTVSKNPFNVVAVHINYNNRPTCPTEVAFLTRWTSLLGVPLYVRHIWELNRDRCNDREFYEKITRIFRFDMYKRFNAPTILGHNQDDAVENIFANIRKGRSLNNLTGMVDISEDDGVIIARPMLNIPKKDIYKFAHKYDIPHLEDSTPKWSDRGRMRDVLIPAIDSFDPSIIAGLLELSKGYKEIYSMVDMGIINTFFNRVDISRKIIPITPLDPENDYGFIFWKSVFTRFFGGLNLRPPSNKAINTAIKRINGRQFGNITLTKGLCFKYDHNGLSL